MAGDKAPKTADEGVWSKGQGKGRVNTVSSEMQPEVD